MSNTDRYASAVLPFICTLSLRSTVASQCHASIHALVNNSALKLIGARIKPARGERQPLADQLEKAYLAVPWTEWQERRPAWNLDGKENHEDTKEARDTKDESRVESRAEPLCCRHSPCTQCSP